MPYPRWMPRPSRGRIVLGLLEQGLIVLLAGICALSTVAIVVSAVEAFQHHPEAIRDWLAMLAIFGVPDALVLALFGLRRRRLRRAWEYAAARLGLTLDREAKPLPGRVCGEKDGCRVVLDTRRPGLNLQVVTTRVAVEAGDLLPWVQIRAERLGTMAEKIVAGEDLQTGDPEFDARAYVRGDEASTLAVLDCATRTQLLRLLAERGAALSDRRITFTCPWEMLNGVELEAAVQDALAVASRLRLAGRSLPALLAQNATSDPLPAVRFRNLRLLLARHAASPEAGRACRQAVHDEGDTAIRIAAARALGPEGWEHLERIAQSEACEEAHRIAALQALNRDLPRDRLLPLLEGLATARVDGVVRLACRTLLDRGCRLRVGQMLAALPAVDAPTAIAFAHDLGELRTKDAEAALVGLLRRPEAEVKAVAAEALARSGSVRAIEPLLACAASGRFLLDAHLRRIVAEAVKSIQSRLGDQASRGQLSVATAAADHGFLSLAQEGGAISLVSNPLPATTGPVAAPVPEGQPPAEPRPAETPRQPPAGERS